MAILSGPELQKYELTGAGIYKEWWANPAVVGLMGFALTTMATGLHNVGYWGAGPTLALAIAFGGTAQFIAGVVDLRPSRSRTGHRTGMDPHLHGLRVRAGAAVCDLPHLRVLQP